ncbi:DUF4388 domain-containing protein [Nocardia thailandica]|uniref:DUF4388 domain-containing protein n=1 Tax=Nocardia thailandica TaxID=257275 RepID=UPI0003071AA9|nr:DUF4388 domain-containing protein [Nocardia thailandica]
MAHSTDITREVVGFLAGSCAGRHTGVLRVTGEPGGEFHLRAGRIVAVRTPGAPGVADLLDALDAAPGAARLRLLHMSAAVDGAFAVAAGWIDECRWYDGAPGPGDPDGFEPEWLLGEARRRLQALMQAGMSPHRNVLTLTAAGERLLRDRADDPRAALLARVDGARSCRDLAFALGRSVYAVSVEVARMLGDGLLAVRAQHATVREAHPRAGTVAPGLPRRRRGASGINDTLRPRPPLAADPASAGPNRPPDRRTDERTP